MLALTKSGSHYELPKHEQARKLKKERESEEWT